MQTFDVGIRAFKAFRRELGAPDVHARASVREVLRFIAYLSRNRKAASTISAYVNAVANYHKMNDWENPCEAFKVKRALKGAARDNTCPDSRAPITPVILAQLIDALPRICQSKYEVSLFRAIFLNCLLWPVSHWRIGVPVKNGIRQVGCAYKRCAAQKEHVTDNAAFFENGSNGKN